MNYNVSHLNVFLIFTMLMLMSCTTLRQIRPLEKGQSALGLSIGGPLTEVGKIYTPLPLLGISYHRGIVNRKLDFETGLQLTQIVYGILQYDAGVNYRPWQPASWRPGFIATPKIFLITDFSPSSLRIYPDLCLSFFWEPRSNFYIYTGIENMFEFSRERDDGNPQKNHWLIAPYLGINAGNNKTLFQFETKIYTPNLENTGRPTKNIGFGDYGILGFFLGVNYTFERRK